MNRNTVSTEIQLDHIVHIHLLNIMTWTQFNNYYYLDRLFELFSNLFSRIIFEVFLQVVMIQFT